MDNACSVTDGIFSGFNRGESNLLQTNAAINQGNKGGALVNSKGQIVGMNVITAESSGYGGIGFAIPINHALSVADGLLDRRGARGRAKIGVKYSEAFNLNYDIYVKQYGDTPRGAYVEYVEPLSGAFKGDMRVGDIITKMNGETVSDYLDLLGIMDGVTPGEIVIIEAFRNGAYFTAEVESSADTDDK